MTIESEVVMAVMEAAAAAIGDICYFRPRYLFICLFIFCSIT